MKLTKPQLRLLQILWSSDKPLTIQGIANKSRYRFAGRLIVSAILEALLEKDAIFRAGALYSYSEKKEHVEIFYAAKLRFSDYYAENFKTITPYNLFHLIESIIQSDSLTCNQLRSLSELIDEKLKPWKS